MSRTTRARVAFAFLGVIALAVVPAFVESYYLSVVTRGLILAMFALAYNVVFGMGGMPSFGHAAFFGTGGYVVGLGLQRADWGLPAVTVVTLVAGALLGGVFGVAVLRARGIYLLLLTLALGQAVWGLAFQQVNVTGGDNGIAGISQNVLPFVTDSTTFYWLVAALFTVVAALLWVFARSAVGRIIVGIRESESRMVALGYRVGSYRIAAFVVSGAFSAVAGALFVFSNRFVGPENLHWPISAEVMIFAILGGARTFIGPAVGAMLLVLAETMAGSYTSRWPTILGLVYVLTILFLPEGLLGLPERLRRRRRTGGPTPTASEALPAEVAG